MTAVDYQARSQEAIDHLVDQHSPRGNRVGTLMIASILIEAWDLYSISFILVFLQKEFHPSALLLGLTAAGTQGGAVLGALAGGWLSDKIGRRTVFLATMVMFVVFGLAQAFAPNMVVLAIIRLLLGIPLGMDIANGYTYIMEFVQRGKREVMGNRWQFMFAVGEVISIAVVLVLLLTGLSHATLWRVVLGLSAVPALALFALRYNLPETAIWLIKRGEFREAKRVTAKMYGDSLDMLPDVDVVVPRPKLSGFLADLRTDPVRWRASVYGWIACFMQSSEFSTFAFYVPVLFVLLGVSSIIGTDLITLGLYLVAVVSGYVGPKLLPRLGHRKLSIAGFSIVFVSLLVAAAAISMKATILLPFVAAAMLWGHYWDAGSVMTIPSMVAAPEYRGTASGFAYVFVKLPAFLSIFLFPSLFTAIGKAGATLFTAVFPLIGLVAAIVVLPEVYGYREARRAPAAAVQ